MDKAKLLDQQKPRPNRYWVWTYLTKPLDQQKLRSNRHWVWTFLKKWLCWPIPPRAFFKAKRRPGKILLDLPRWWWAYSYALGWYLWIGTGIPHFPLFGRQTDPDPVFCAECGWAARRRDCYHGYQADGMGDVEAVDRCQRCNEEM